MLYSKITWNLLYTANNNVYRPQLIFIRDLGRFLWSLVSMKGKSRSCPDFTKMQVLNYKEWTNLVHFKWIFESICSIFFFRREEGRERVAGGSSNSPFGFPEQFRSGLIWPKLAYPTQIKDSSSSESPCIVLSVRGTCLGVWPQRMAPGAKNEFLPGTQRSKYSLHLCLTFQVPQMPVPSAQPM